MNTRSRIQKLVNYPEIKNSQNKGHAKISESTVITDRSNAGVLLWLFFMSVSVAFRLMYYRLFLFGLGSGVATFWTCSLCVMAICNFS